MNYYSMNDYCRETFGKKLYKLSLDGGFTCPNRDGTKGKGGCIFCSAAGAGEFAAHGADVNEQLEQAKKRVAAKNKNGGYIAYFQSFTNTYAPVSRLRELFLPVVERPDVDVLSIATRPDCLGNDVLTLLSDLNKKKPVWVELGLQTVKPESIAFIRRGYETEVYVRAAAALKARGIYLITHVILGLPGETAEDMEQTLRCALAAGTNGVKFHLLHVLKDSDLYPLWLEGKIKTLTKEEYLLLLQRLVPLLPPGVAVHRLTGDGDKKTLVSPLWSANKKDVLNSIHNMKTP
ncbi:MAG: TIGR01212 family radical SAM protein [Clostridia bacterium]|nr:TIGR01212 family radical SAM protein [Clostridia bacterium]